RQRQGDDSMLKTLNDAPHSPIPPSWDMIQPVATKTSPHAAEPDQSADPRMWAIVLAGGQGVRLRSLVSRIYGDERPKQYAALLDSRTLLEHTLDRVALLVERERTVVVTMRDHDRYLAPYFSGENDTVSHPHVLWQPEDRGTAAGVLL